jgi:hypothetical protein
MKRAFTKFEGALILELATIANLLVDKLNAPRDPEGPEYLNLSSLALREVIETTIRVAAARKRLARLRRLRRPGRCDEIGLDADELARLRLGGIDLDSPFDVEDLKP